MSEKKLKEKFADAMEWWEVNSDSRRILALLEPLFDKAGYDIMESPQKGSDCMAIEVSCHYLAPDCPHDSGDAAMYLADLLGEDFEDIQIAYKDRMWTVACFRGEGIGDGPTAQHGVLGIALLECLFLHYSLTERKPKLFLVEDGQSGIGFEDGLD